MGYSRDTFYRFRELYDTGGELALQEISRKKPVKKNRIEAHIEDAVVKLATTIPLWARFVYLMSSRRKDCSFPLVGVHSVWLHHDLETFKKRFKALETLVVQDGLILTEHQVAALEKKKVIQLKLYDRKNALVAADILNDRVIPFFEKHKIRLLRNLIDRGTEHCGAREHHEYQLYMALEQLQEDLDRWVYEYNFERTHTGNHCYGKTPMQTFLDSIHLAKEKMLDQQYENMNSEDHLTT